MRRMILAPLVLFPVLAHGQASTSIERKPFNSSAVFQTGVNRPAGLYSQVALAAAEIKESPASMGSMTAGSHVAVRESVRAMYSDDFVEAALRQGGTLEYSMNATPAEASAPKVIRAVEVDL